MKKSLELIFTVSFALSLVGGIVIVLGQFGSILLKNVPTLTYLGEVFVIPVCILGSVSAIASFLLSYTYKDGERA